MKPRRRRHEAAPLKKALACALVPALLAWSASLVIGSWGMGFQVPESKITVEQLSGELAMPVGLQGQAAVTCSIPLQERSAASLAYIEQNGNDNYAEVYQSGDVEGGPAT